MFRSGGRTLMVYGRMRTDYAPEVALAYRQDGQWRKCPRPFFTVPETGWYRRNLIDPEPLVLGNRLYLCFGGGVTSSLGATWTAGSASGSTGPRAGLHTGSGSHPAGKDS